MNSHIDTRQVARTNRARTRAPGAAFTVVEQDSFRAKITAAMRKRKAESQDGPAAKALRVKRRVNEPYFATLKWLRALNSSLVDVLSHGLEWYMTKPRTFNDDFAPGEAAGDNVLVCGVDE